MAAAKVGPARRCNSPPCFATGRPTAPSKRLLHSRSMSSQQASGLSVTPAAETGAAYEKYFASSAVVASGMAANSSQGNSIPEKERHFLFDGESPSPAHGAVAAAASSTVVIRTQSMPSQCPTVVVADSRHGGGSLPLLTDEVPEKFPTSAKSSSTSCKKKVKDPFATSPTLRSSSASTPPVEWIWDGEGVYRRRHLDRPYRQYSLIAVSSNHRSALPYYSSYSSTPTGAMKNMYGGSKIGRGWGVNVISDGDGTTMCSLSPHPIVGPRETHLPAAAPPKHRKKATATRQISTGSKAKQHKKRQERIIAGRAANSPSGKANHEGQRQSRSVPHHLVTGTTTAMLAATGEERKRPESAKKKIEEREAFSGYCGVKIKPPPRGRPASVPSTRGGRYSSSLSWLDLAGREGVRACKPPTRVISLRPLKAFTGTTSFSATSGTTEIEGASAEEATMQPTKKRPVSPPPPSSAEGSTVPTGIFLATKGSGGDSDTSAVVKWWRMLLLCGDKPQTLEPAVTGSPSPKPSLPSTRLSVQHPDSSLRHSQLPTLHFSLSAIFPNLFAGFRDCGIVGCIFGEKAINNDDKVEGKIFPDSLPLDDRFFSSNVG